MKKAISLILLICLCVTALFAFGACAEVDVPDNATDITLARYRTYYSPAEKD